MTQHPSPSSPTLLTPRRPSPEDLLETDKMVESLTHFGKPNNDPQAKPDFRISKLLRSKVFHVPVQNSPTNGPSNGTHPNQQSTRKITSWTMSDYAYKRDPCPYPTMARGLFTETDTSKKVGEGRHKIVVRGYDKFFNVGEVSSTKWQNLPSNTTSPYHLTLKSNGCIIFIAALSPTQLLVTSKHSMGPKGGFKIAGNNKQQKGDGDDAKDATENGKVGGEKNGQVPTKATDEKKTEKVEKDDEDEEVAGFDPDEEDEGLDPSGMSHAERGENWLWKHLKQAGKSKEEFAKVLWEADATAVAELCDDSFEEHVIPYSPEATGLHLHGLNLNSTQLLTYSSTFVNKFAAEWGFIINKHLILPSLEQVKSFTDEIEKDKVWKGEQVEGFVVRCGRKGGEEIGDGQVLDGTQAKAHEEFFTKIKFNEPYLMYREWREVTRKLLDERRRGNKTKGKGGKNQSTSSVNPSKFRNKQTGLYVKWVTKKMDEDLSYFDEWKVGRGIIKTRNDFLAWKDGVEGKKESKAFMEEAAAGAKEKVAGKKAEKGERFDKTLIVPVSIPGSGKTLIGNALNHLYKVAHTQSDDITSKKPAPAFVKNVRSLLNQRNNKIVFADKNNHLRQHRKQMVELVDELSSKPEMKIRLVAMVWETKGMADDQVLKIMSDRIVGRGQNHQSLRPSEDPNNVGQHEMVLWKFLQDRDTFEPGLYEEDDRFHDVIYMNVDKTPVEALKIAVNRLREIVPELKEPTDAELEKAIEAALNYKPTTKKEIPPPQPQKKETNKPPRYFGIALKINKKTLVSEGLTKSSSSPQFDSAKAFFENLVKSNRLSGSEPHVTILHQQEIANAKGETKKAEAQELYDYFLSLQDKPEAQVKVTLGPRLAWNGDVMSLEVSKIEPDGILRKAMDTKTAHVTIGTRHASIPALKGKELMRVVTMGQQKGKEKFETMDIGTHVVQGTIKGMFA